MHLFTETLIQMAFIIVPIMAIAFVGALAGNFCNLVSFYVRANEV